MKKYYITTPLYYVNAAPHIGHAYTTVAADVLARHMRSKARTVHLLTGTDEHGLKIEEAAREAGLSPQAFADRISSQFRDLWKHLDIHFDDFIRTTEGRHESRVQECFAQLLQSGDIYKGRYQGYYCVSDETYWTQTETAPDEKGRRLCPNPECRKPLQQVEEESYFFRLSKYQEPLLRHYRGNPDFLRPAHRANEILRFVEGGLQDTSVSRTKVKWGVGVPGDQAHTVYVWFDALLNYVTAPKSSPDFLDIWPADVHIVGKEIYRFHAVTWPAMLLALGLPLPKSVFAHGWWTVDGAKMSKSRGNFVDPRDITREFGVDALRYFLLREMPFGNDGDFSRESLRKRYNAELANDLGNLINRVVDMVDRYLAGELPRRASEEGPSLARELADKSPAITARMEDLDFCGALALIWEAVGRLNAHVNEKAPWKLVKTDPEATKAILFDLVRCLRIVTGWIEPFMPQTAAKIHSQLGVRQFPGPLSPEQVLSGETQGTGRIQKAPPLFPRK
ncbi:MAG TPA: methionine--tRNA ligase [Elusimicrobia bacterium]|nr:methionine--tRNA ligase [Elusimicrobiota bacterium]